MSKSFDSVAVTADTELHAEKQVNEMNRTYMDPARDFNEINNNQRSSGGYRIRVSAPSSISAPGFRGPRAIPFRGAALNEEGAFSGRIRYDVRAERDARSSHRNYHSAKRRENSDNTAAFLDMHDDGGVYTDDDDLSEQTIREGSTTLITSEEFLELNAIAAPLPKDPFDLVCGPIPNAATCDVPTLVPQPLDHQVAGLTIKRKATFEITPEVGDLAIADMLTYFPLRRLIQKQESDLYDDMVVNLAIRAKKGLV